MARWVLRRRGTIALVLGLAGALGAAAASAQEPLPAGSYGGGAIVDPPESIYGRGNMIITLRSTGTGKVQILAGLGASCPTAAIKTSATLAADGSFSASGVSTENLGGGERARTTYEIKGVIGDAASASGTASARSKFTRQGSATRRCETGSVAFGARRAPGAVGTPGVPQSTARLYGTTAQRVDKRRHGIVLRISADARRVTRTLYTLNYRCGERTSNVPDAPRRNLPIGADGKVSDVERYSEKLDKRTRIRYTERFSGTVGSAGATGKFNLSARIVDIASGRTVGRCRSGSVKWTAAL